VPFGNGPRQVGDLRLEFLPLDPHGRQVISRVIQARAQLALEFLEGERGDIFAQHFPLQS
jgi:hypothetical protein